MPVMKTESKAYQTLYGGILLLISLALIWTEYLAIYKPLPSESYRTSYVIYSELLFFSKWCILGALLLASVAMILRTKFSNYLLLLFSLAALLEIYVSENLYIVKTIEGFSMHTLLTVSIVSLALAAFNLFNIQKLNYSGFLFSAAAATILVYLPNALITLRF